MSINRNNVLKAAQKHLRKKNWDKALKEYRKLVEDDPSDMRSRLKCGDLLVKLGKQQEAVEAYKRVADAYGQQDMYEKAIAVYKQAQRLDEEDVALLHAIGECYYRLGRLKDAIRCFHQAQRTYKERGDFENQRTMLEHMVRIDPEDVGLRIQLAERYTKEGRTQDALSCFLFSVEKLEQEGRLDELVQVLERTVYLAPDRRDLRTRLIRLHLDRQDNQAALKHLQVAFRESPEDMEIMDLLALAFERLGREEKAVLVLQELGPLYEKVGRDADAQNLYRRILRLDPENQVALEATGKGPDSGMLAQLADTGALPSRQNTPAPETLEGVEFLDDDEFGAVEFLDEEEDEKVEEVVRVEPQGFPPVEEDGFVDLTEDIELVPEPAATEEMSVEELDESEVRAMLAECQVFLRYGLYDKAAVAIGRVLEIAPSSVYAHEQQLVLSQKTGDVEGQYRTLITLAELTADMPARAYLLLQEALELAPNPQAVRVRAEALGIDLDSPPLEGLEEISVEVLPEPVAAASAEVYDDDSDSLDGGLFYLDDEEEDLEYLDESLDEETSEAPESLEGFESPSSHTQPLSHDAAVQALAGLGAAEEETGLTEDTFIPDEEEPQGLEEPTDQTLGQDDPDLEVLEEVEELDLGDVEELEDLDELEDLGVLEDLGDLEDLSSESGIVADDDLDLGDVDIVEMDLDGAEEIDESDFIALEEEEEGDRPDLDNLFDGVDADELFGDLFGGGADEEVAINLGSDDPIGEMAEIDFFLQQGLAEEAEEALESFAAEHPSHPGLAKRENQLRQLKAGQMAQENPFGARSLSQKFNPTSLESESNPELINFSSVVNSNLELGVAYRDMGLVEDAINEFRQAAEDPEAMASAQYNIALCEIDRGDLVEAKSLLNELLTHDDLEPEIAETVRQKLAELGTRAS